MSEEKKIDMPPIPDEKMEAETVPHSTQTENETKDINQSEQKENSKEYNFKQLRESKKQMENELLAMKKQMEEMKNTYNPVVKEQKEEEIELSDDDIPEWKHVKKYISKLENKIKSKETQAIPDKLKQKFNDFESVVTKENVERLAREYPEVHATLTEGKDLYKKGIAAYNTLKAFGIYKEDTYKADKEAVQQNAQKPMSTQAIKGHGALHEANAFANGLTPTLKAQLLKEMTDAAKQA